MESNVQPLSIKRAAKAIGVVDEICRSISDELSVQAHTNNLNISLDMLREKKRPVKF